MSVTTRLRTLLQSATPGEWHGPPDDWDDSDDVSFTLQDYDCGAIATCHISRESDGRNRSFANSRLIAESHNALPDILDVVDAAEVVAREGAMTTQEELDALRTALGKLKGE